MARLKQTRTERRDAFGVQSRPRTKRISDHIHSWLVTVDHKKLGLMYIMYGLFFFVVAGLEAALIRIQLAVPNNHFFASSLQPAVHHARHHDGVSGRHAVDLRLRNYLVPLMIGARDLAFPRLNAFGFWLSAFGGLLLYFSFIGGEGMAAPGSAPDVGWFAYAPLTARRSRPGTARTIGFWASCRRLRLHRHGHQHHHHVLCMRCRGMTLTACRCWCG
jgi:cytochrome c oxidase subunit I